MNGAVGTVPPRLARALAVVALAVGIGVLIWMATAVLDRVHGVLTMLALAVLAAYLVAPAVQRLVRVGVPRALAVLGVYLAFIAILGAGTAWLAPRAAAEVGDLAHRAPAIAHDVTAQTAHPATSPLLARIPRPLRPVVVANAARAEAAASAFLTRFGGGVVGAVRTGADSIVRTLLVLFLAFFFITDAERIVATALRPVPPSRRPTVLAWLRDIDRVVGGFVRGQVLLAALVGVAVIIVLLVLGVPYAVLLGLLSGVASIVPFVGPVVGALPALVLAAISVGLVKTVILLVLFAVIFELQGHVLTPIVIGRTVGVTPLVVFLAILIGAEAFGLLGMLLAIPVAGILRVALDRLAPADPRLPPLVASTFGSPVADAASAEDVTAAHPRV